MPVKSTFEEKPKNRPSEEFEPAIYKYIGGKEDTFIVYFRTPTKGVVIYTKNTEHPFAELGVSYSSFLDKTRWEKFCGTVTLEQS